MVPILILALFVVGGLVVDGSRDLNARGDAQAYAEEAARAGATAVDLTQADLALDDALAAQRVAGYCAAVEKNSSVHVVSCGLRPDAFTLAPTCGGASARIVVNTEVRLRIDTTLLGIVGARQLSVTGQASARPYEGTTAGNAC